MAANKKAPEQIFVDLEEQIWMPPNFLPTSSRKSVHFCEYVRCTIDELTKLRRMFEINLELNRINSLLEFAGVLGMREEDELVQEEGKLKEEFDSLLSSLRSSVGNSGGGE